jgi:predicted transcriptional regulator YdeE
MQRQGELGEHGATYGVSRLRGDGFYYVVGAEHAAMKDLPAGMEQADVPAGRYYRYYYSGPAAEVGGAYMQIFMELLPAAGLAPAENGIALEAYGPDAMDEETGTMTLTIYIQLAGEGSAA